ncbi:VapB-type antitoxin [Sulfolobus sp. A20]|uniref:VapB-type antitoxin n=1 Tax=Sulfolobaceae TaxID=118883 RepID=UPI000863C6CB|nr:MULTISPECIES: VapB-type antitoxin [unclassified Sulfolobus]AOL16572.1 VapB-type antitoxin [Sulfolobus sp. A20]
MSNITTISISEKTKKLLELKKKEIEEKINRPLSWDEFFNELLKEEVPKLSPEKAELLKKIIKEDRTRWKRRFA